MGDEENKMEKYFMSEINEEFSMDKLSRAIHMIRKDSAPKLNNVDYLMLKNFPLKV